MEERNGAKLPVDFDLYPGKMDHTTCCCVVVGGHEEGGEIGFEE